MKSEYKDLLAYIFKQARTENEVGTFYKGPNSALLQCGKFYYRPTLSKEFNKKFTTHCYKTASRAAFEDSSLRYVEGVVWDGLPESKFIHHGFLLDMDGTVIDKTYRGKNNDQAFYFGLEVPTWLVSKLLDIHGYYGLFRGKNRHWYRTEYYLRTNNII